MKLNIPSDVIEIINRIYENKFEAYIVGGCVRDSLLNVIPHDYDITTNATPEDVINIFKDYKVIPTGIKHGTITLILNNNQYEITTYRIEGKYSDNRRPDEVKYSKDIYEDLKRRDFTINAMAYNHINGLVDKFMGVKDLENELIKCVGDSNERFNEDALRMIRAIRFSAKLGFNIEKETLDNIYKNAHLIKNISKERIHDEINKILISNDVSKIKLLHDTKMINYIGFNDKKISEEELILFSKSQKSLQIRLVLYLHMFYEKNEAIKFLKEMKYSNQIRNYCEAMLNIININLENNKKNIKLKLSKIGYDKFYDLINIKNVLACNNKVESENLIKIKSNLKEIIDLGEVYLLSQLKVNGKDLQSIGYKGKSIGEELNNLLLLVINDNSLNDKQILLDIAQQNIQKYKI